MLRSDMSAILLVSQDAEGLASAGINLTGHSDHGFAHVVGFRDPDGPHVELLEPIESA
jgi:catechol-2,3-dioxygenase